MEWVLLGLACLFILWSLTRGVPKFSAATNAILAEHTLGLVELVPENPFAKRLKDQVIDVWRRMGFPNMTEDQVAQSFNGLTRIGQLNILAIAFAELGDRPYLPGESWQYVRRPLLMEDEAHVRAVAARMKSKHGVDIHIPTERFQIVDWGIVDNHYSDKRSRILKTAEEAAEALRDLNTS